MKKKTLKLPLRYEAGDLVDGNGRKVAELYDGGGTPWCGNNDLAEHWATLIVRCVNERSEHNES